MYYVHVHVLYIVCMLYIKYDSVRGMLRMQKQLLNLRLKPLLRKMINVQHHAIGMAYSTFTMQNTSPYQPAIGLSFTVVFPLII